jgi:hypothetical protein
MINEDEVQLSEFFSASRFLELLKFSLFLCDYGFLLMRSHRHCSSLRCCHLVFRAWMEFVVFANSCLLFPSLDKLFALRAC